MASRWWQETSACDPCIESPICPPPGGDNRGDPQLPTVCGELPNAGDPGGGDPPPPWTGGGGKKIPPDGGGGDDPPFPPIPPIIDPGGGGGPPPGPPDVGPPVQPPGGPPPPPGVTPGGPAQPPGGGGDCGCVFTDTSITTKDLGDGCTRFMRFYYYTCKKIKPTDPPDPFDGDLGDLFGDPNNSKIGSGSDTTTNHCGPTNCGGNCAKKWMQWTSCEGDGGSGDPVDPGGEIGGGLLGGGGGLGDPVDGGDPIGGGLVGGGGGLGDPIDGGDPIGGDLFGGDNISNNTNSNLPGLPKGPRPDVIYRPTNTTNSNLPGYVNPSNLPSDSILGIRKVAGAATPTNVTNRGRVASYDSKESTTTQPFINYENFDPSLQVYDIERSISVQSAITSLKRAEMRVKTFGKPDNILNERIHRTLNDIIRTQGGISFVPFNGVTIGSYLFNSSLVTDSLNQLTLSSLRVLRKHNIMSLSLSEDLIQGVRQSILKGTIDNYSASLFNEMARTSLALWPNGLPFIETTNKREAAYNLIRQTRKSLNPSNYPGNGNSQQTIRRTRQIPTDIDLTLPIVIRSGVVTGARFANNDGLPVSLTGGTIGYAKQENEYLGIVTRESTIPVQAELRSNRDTAYAFDANQRNVIEELLTNGSNIGTSFEFSSTPPSTTDVEVCSTPLAIPEILVFSSMRETLTDTFVATPELQGTKMTYELAWQPGDADSILDDIVGPWIGPRATFYIASDDPIWNYILDLPPGETRAFVTATFSTVTIPLDNKVYPRQIYTDFALAPTNNIKYDPLQGGSTLTAYTSGANIKRTINLVPSPFLSIQNETYVKSVPSRTDIDGTTNIYGMNWTKAFSTGDYTGKLSTTGDSFTTSASVFSTVYNRIKRIDENYDLQDGYQGKRLPKGDLTSFLTLPQIIEMYQLPEEILSNLFNGVYNNIKIYSNLKEATEKTYISTTRLTGTDLSSEQLQTIVPELPYFDTRYKGKLY